MMESKPKVLLITDDNNWLDNIYNHLVHLNIEISIAETIQDAKSYAVNTEFALALLYTDLSSDELYQFNKSLAQTEKNSVLPILMIKVNNQEYDELFLYLRAGAVDVIDEQAIPHLLPVKVHVFLELFKQRTSLENEIEQRKLSEQELRITQSHLRVAKEKAEESDKLKSAFLANMSHEIRTPMNAIVGFSNLLASEELNDKQRKQYCVYINNSSNTLLRLIDDILDIARIEAGQLNITKSEFGMHEVCCELYKVFREELEHKNKGHLRLNLSLPQNNYVLQNDEMRIRQVLTNLLNNAIKFTQEGEIELGYYPKDNQLHFYVKDTGIGIPKDKQHLVFERFERIENTGMPKTSGTGLGLSISKKIIELLGGNMWLTSDGKTGSTFYFSLKFDGSATNGMSKSVNGMSSKLPDINWREKHILIAEDEVLNFHYIKEILKKTGAKIMWARDGKQAVNLAAKNPTVNLILMDIKMPHLDGYGAMHSIKQILPNTPIIAQTAYAMSEEKDKCLQSGFDDYISKPIKASTLYSKMSAIFNAVQENKAVH